MKIQKLKRELKKRLFARERKKKHENVTIKNIYNEEKKLHTNYK